MTNGARSPDVFDRYLFWLVVVARPHGNARHRILFTNEFTAHQTQVALQHFYRQCFDVVLLPSLWMLHGEFLYHNDSRLPLHQAVAYANQMDRAFILHPELIPRLIGERGCLSFFTSLFRPRWRLSRTQYSFQCFEDLCDSLLDDSDRSDVVL